MKKLLSVLLPLLLVSGLSAQPTPVQPRAASQAQVNASPATDGVDFVTPLTLAGWTGGGGGSALPNGTTATTQAVADNSTKVATDAFVLANAGGSALSPGSTTSALNPSTFQLVTQNASSTWVLAESNTLGTSTAVELVTAASGSAFTGTTHGLVTGMSGLTAGTQYYLSDATPGAYTSTNPSTAGHYSVPVFFAITTTSAIVNVGPPALIVGGVVSTTSAGTAYTLTNSASTVAMGTTNPVVTLNATGHWLISVNQPTGLVGATFAAPKACTLSLYRSNNTPGALAGGTFSSTFPIMTTATDIGPNVNIANYYYQTSNTTDTITYQASVTATPSAGSVTLTANATITAQWVGP